MFLSYLSMTVLLITGIFLIIIVLLQRGRGGGLAGAFGGLGGQSAFGTKAGDVFTKITIVLAVFWVVLAGLSGLALERDSDRRYRPDAEEESISAPVNSETGLPTTTPETPKDGEAGSATKTDEKPGEKAADTKATPTESTPAAKEGAPAEKAAPDTKAPTGDAAATPPAEEKKPAEGTDAGKPADPAAK